GLVLGREDWANRSPGPDDFHFTESAPNARRYDRGGNMPTIRGGDGAGIRLKAGRLLQITNTLGSQVVDLFAHNAKDVEEVLSIQHSRNAWYRLDPRPGDELLTQLRRPILTFIEDSSPGVHDTLFPCCDAARYKQLGVEGYHRSCAENWRRALL